MRIRIILVCGLALSLLGRAFGQEVLPTQDFASPTGSEVGGLDIQPQESLTFAPSNNDRWFTAEFLFGWVEGAHLPALVTTSPLGTAKEDAGVIPATPPSVSTILLNGTVNRDVVPGFRLGTGFIFDKEYGLGVEAGLIFLPGQSSSFLFSSTTNPILALPFNDATTGTLGDPSDPQTPSSLVVAFPGVSTGNIRVDAKSGNFYAFNFDLSERVWDQNEDGLRLDALFGYRFAAFQDRLAIREHIVPLSMPAGTFIDGADVFSTQNTFHGLDMGLRATYAWDRFSLNLLSKVAAGNMHRTVNIRGQTISTAPGPAPGAPPVTSTAAGGLYALSSNIGRHTGNDWTVLPEAGANLNWQLRSNVVLRCGYSLLYLTKVARADDQIDFTVNPNLIPGDGFNASSTPKRPAFIGHHSDMWIQTINVGLDVTF